MYNFSFTFSNGAVVNVSSSRPLGFTERNLLEIPEAIEDSACDMLFLLQAMIRYCHGVQLPLPLEDHQVEVTECVSK